MTLSANPTRTGIDLAWVDADVRPQDDLFTHVNGRWLATHEIPDDRAQDGTFVMLRDRAEDDVRAIVEGAAEQADDDARRIAALYASFMDVERVEALGVEPLRPLLDEIAAAPDHTALAARARPPPARGARVAVRLVRLHRREGPEPLPRAPEPVRPRAAGRVVLPRGVLRRDPHGLRRPPRTPRRAGRACPSPRGSRRPVMELETALAAASWDRVTNRDAEKTYTLHDGRRAAASALPRSTGTPGSTALGAPEGAFAEVVVRQPSFVEAAATLWAGAPARAVAGVARAPHRLGLRRLPVRRRRAGGLRLLRPHAVGHAGAARSGGSAASALVEGALGEAVGQALRRAALPGVGEGADDHARREPRRGLPAEHLHAGLDGPGHPRAGAGEARQVHAQDRLPGQVAGLLGARGARRRPARQRPARGRVAHRPRARQDRQAGRPRRVVHDPADRQRLLPPAA